jgi:hypothetical protein
MGTVYSQSTEAISERTPRPLAGNALQFDLGSEIASLASEPAWTEHGHNARTLAKYADYRVVLVVLARGARMKEAQVDQSVIVHALAGRVRVHVPDNGVDMAHGIDVPAGHLLALDSCVAFDIEALDESAFLLSLGWSKARSGGGVHACERR